jgi:hypothetical protein
MICQVQVSEALLFSCRGKVDYERRGDCKIAALRKERVTTRRSRTKVGLQREDGSSRTLSFIPSAAKKL